MYEIKTTKTFAKWLSKLKDMRSMMMNSKLVHFDITEYLDSEEAMAEYLSQVLEDGDNEEFIRAIGHIAKAKGMAQIAKDTGLGRESLYKAFRPNAKPRFETVMKVMQALNMQFSTSVHAV